MLHALANLDSENMEIRERAIAVLGDVGDESVVARLFEALRDDSNQSVQNRAALALGSRLTNNVALQREIVDQLLIASVQIDRGELMYAAQHPPTLIAIMLIGVPAAARLVELIREYRGPSTEILGLPTSEHPSQSVYNWIHLAVLLLDRQVVPFLIPELQHPHQEVRHTVAATLGHICVPEALPGLLKLTLDPEAQTQNRVFMALGQISHEYSHLHSRFASYFVDFAQKHFNDIKDRHTHYYLIGMLAISTDESVVKCLLDILDQEPDDHVCGYVLESLRKIQGVPLTPRLLMMLTETTSFTIPGDQNYYCDLAAQIISNNQTDEITPILTTWKQKRIASLIQAIQTLGEEWNRMCRSMIGTWLQPSEAQEILPYLIAAVNGVVPFERSSNSFGPHPLLDVMGKIGDESVLPLLEAVLGSGYSQNMEKPLEVMGEIALRYPNTPIAQRVRNFLLTSPNLGWMSITTLGKIGNEEAIPLLLRFMEEVQQLPPEYPGEVFEPVVLRRIFIALGQIGRRHRAAAPEIEELLQSYLQIPVNRQSILLSLGELGSQTSLSLLFESLADPDPLVRVTALKAISIFIHNELDLAVQNQIVDNIIPLLQDWTKGYLRGHLVGDRVCVHAWKVLDQLRTPHAIDAMNDWAARHTPNF
jgi:HEAT repeat protein